MSLAGSLRGAQKELMVKRGVGGWGKENVRARDEAERKARAWKCESSSNNLEEKKVSKQFNTLRFAVPKKTCSWVFPTVKKVTRR